jgi:hypothetical protein
MRFPAVALVGFAATSLICSDCDVRWIGPATAQAQDAGKESQAVPATDAEPTTLGECFPLRMMNNPRIDAKWGGKMKLNVNYLAEVVAGRATQPMIQ